MTYREAVEKLFDDNISSCRNYHLLTGIDFKVLIKEFEKAKKKELDRIDKDERERGQIPLIGSTRQLEKRWEEIINILEDLELEEIIANYNEKEIESLCNELEDIENELVRRGAG